MFRLLGLAPGTSITSHAAAGLAGLPEQEARGLLAELVGAFLLAQQVADRYTFHDLLRAYAAELAHGPDSEQERRRALTGLFDYYLATADAAMEALHPAEKHRRERAPAHARAVAPVATPDPAAARDWLDAERASLVAVAVHAAAGVWPGHAIALAPILHRYLEAGGHLLAAQAVFGAALRAARQTGDLAAQAYSLRFLGAVDSWQGQHQQAAGKLRSAQRLYQQLGDRRGQSRALINLGIVDSMRGRLPQAADLFGRSLALSREIGESPGATGVLTNLGLVEMRQGHYDQAAGHHRESLAIFRQVGDRHGEAIALDNLGAVLCHQGHYQRAEDHHGQALMLFRELGNRRGEAEALQNLGHALREQARHRQADELYRQALAIFREIGDRSSEAEVLSSLAETRSRHP